MVISINVDVAEVVKLPLRINANGKQAARAVKPQSNRNANGKQAIRAVKPQSNRNTNAVEVEAAKHHAIKRTNPSEKEALLTKKF